MTAPKKVQDAAGRTVWEIRTTIRADGARPKQQVRRRFKTEKEAKTELARLAHEQNEGTYIHPDKSLTVRKLAERWAEAKATDRSENTQLHYDLALVRLIEAYGDLPLGDLTDRHLMKLRDEMLSGSSRRVGAPGKPLSPRSCNAMLGAVSGLLAYGVKLRVLTRNVADPALVARVRDGETEVDERRSGWGEAELGKFRAAVAGDWYEASWLLSAQGLRRGEVLGLQWKDIDWQAATVSVRRTRIEVKGKVIVATPKSRESRRTLKMGNSVMDALQRQRARQTVNAEGWVTVDGEGEPPRPEWFSDEFGRVIKAASLPEVVLHGVRHAVATTMDAHRIPLADIAKRLGQSQASLAVTLGYIHGSDLSGDAIRAALGD
jgi:integrase